MEIKVDDSIFVGQLQRAERLGLVSIDRVEYSQSRSRRGLHVYVFLTKPLGLRRRIFLQSLLGSDPVREMMNLTRSHALLADGWEVYECCFFEVTPRRQKFDYQHD